MIRADPTTMRQIFERLHLLYYHLDTLTQSFAGVIGHSVFNPPQSPDQLFALFLDYLHPCRSLDPRLNALFTALLDVAKKIPKQQMLQQPTANALLEGSSNFSSLPWLASGKAPPQIVFAQDATVIVKTKSIPQLPKISTIKAQPTSLAVNLQGFVLEFGQIELNNITDTPLVLIARYTYERQPATHFYSDTKMKILSSLKKISHAKSPISN